MTDELVRAAAITQVCLIITCGIALHLGYRRAIPSLAWWAGWGFGYTIAATGAAVFLNLLLDEPLTAGTRFITAALAPAAVWVLAFTIAALRANRRP